MIIYFELIVLDVLQKDILRDISILGIETLGLGWILHFQILKIHLMKLQRGPFNLFKILEYFLDKL